MDREKVNNVLNDVIQEARELNIPVPENIIREVFINKRPKRRFGCCHFREGKFLIEISEFILECEEEKIREVIAHEILHTCKDCRNHGEKWKEYAAKMKERYRYNIKRVSSFEEMGIDRQDETKELSKENVRYIIKCTKCGKEYPRQRFTCVMKKINAYRCQCGGKLILHKYSR